MTNKKKWFMHTILKMQNRWYKWNSQTPAGSDCSGMIIEDLRAVGEIKGHEDYSAAALYRIYKEKKQLIPHPKEAALAFYFNRRGECYHVTVCLDEEFCMTANRGGRHVTDPGTAAEYEAFVTIRPIFHHSKATVEFIDLRL